MPRPIDIDRRLDRFIGIELYQSRAMDDAIHSVGKVAIAGRRKAKPRVGHITGDQLDRAGLRYAADPFSRRNLKAIAMAQYPVLANKTDHAVALRCQRGRYLAAQQTRCPRNQITGQFSST